MKSTRLGRVSASTVHRAGNARAHPPIQHPFLMPRVLLTTTSFQDTPGVHHQMLDSAGFEILRERGPLSEETMLRLVGDIDGLLCGDDAITARVIEKALPRLKVISKYGIGLDKIDVKRATELRVPVLFTPGVNHTTVAEHTFALLLALQRRVVELSTYVRNGSWKRVTGHELMGSTIGIVGVGRIGREVAIRAKAFGMNVVGFGHFWEEDFAASLGMQRCHSIDDLIAVSDIITLHTKLTNETRGLFNAARLAKLKPGAVIVNCARGELLDTAALVAALESGQLAGYAADVMDQEPPPADHPLLKAKNCIITPHVGSRTHENVQRQASMAVENISRFFRGEKPLAQANTIA